MGRKAETPLRAIVCVLLLVSLFMFSQAFAAFRVIGPSGVVVAESFPRVFAAAPALSKGGEGLLGASLILFAIGLVGMAAFLSAPIFAPHMWRSVPLFGYPVALLVILAGLICFVSYIPVSGAELLPAGIALISASGASVLCLGWLEVIAVKN